MRRSLLIAGALALGIAGAAAVAVAHGVGESGGHRHGAAPDFAALDADGDGVITKQEFVDAMLGRMRERLDQRFDRLDADADGAVTVADLTAARAAMMERFQHRHAGCAPGAETPAPELMPDAAPATPDAGP